MKIVFDNYNIPIGAFGDESPTLATFAAPDYKTFSVLSEKDYWLYGIDGSDIVYLPDSGVQSWFVLVFPDYTHKFCVPDSGQTEMPIYTDPGKGKWVKVQSSWAGIADAVRQADFVNYKKFVAREFKQRMRRWFRENIDDETVKMARLKEMGVATPKEIADYNTLAGVAEAKRQEYKQMIVALVAAETVAQIKPKIQKIFFEWSNLE